MSKTNFKELYKNKKVVIMGLGLHGGGLGSAKFFANLEANVLVTDLYKEDILKPVLNKLKKYKNISYRLGEHNEKDLLNNDTIIVNPAAKPSSKYVKLLIDNKKEIETDLGIFLKYFPGLIIGITGTKGKSTVTMLTYNLIENELKNKKRTFLKNYERVILGGNIRKSVLDSLKNSKETDIAVLELSSFQLEYAKFSKVSPRISIITNIHPEHLNWHKDMKDYIDAKSYIYKFQDKEGILIADKKLKKTLDLNGYKGKLILTNGENNDFVYQIAKVLKIDEKNVNKVIKNFKGLEGRQEMVGKLKDLTFINDTCATHPLATLYALNKYLNPILIWGGVDKGFDLIDLKKYLEKNNIKIVLFPGTGSDKLAELLKSKYVKEYIYPAISMNDALKVAMQIRKKEKYILLSPGCASFNMFLNEFDRGEKFNKEVKKLLK